jgi:hypothetical protein
MMLIERERSLKDFAGAITLGPPVNAEKAPINDFLSQSSFLAVCLRALPEFALELAGAYVRKPHK